MVGVSMLLKDKVDNIRTFSISTTLLEFDHQRPKGIDKIESRDIDNNNNHQQHQSIEGKVNLMQQQGLFYNINEVLCARHLKQQY